jgi:NADH:ubiquinone oxidoreductase subunit E
MDILVCIGSSCHKRGSYDVMKRIRTLIAENTLSDTVKLNSAFCLGRCHVDGITIKIGDQFIYGVGLENIDDVFEEYVIGK